MITLRFGMLHAGYRAALSDTPPDDPLMCACCELVAADTIARGTAYGDANGFPLAISCHRRESARVGSGKMAAELITELIRKRWPRLFCVRPLAVAAITPEFLMSLDIRITCRGCSSPATHGEFCAYCSSAFGGAGSRCGFLDRVSSDANAARLTVFTGTVGDRRERVNQAERRELAKPHPWELDE